MTDNIENKLSEEVKKLNTKDTSFLKLNRTQWNTIEKRVNSFNKQVIESQKTLGYEGSKKYKISNNKIRPCGDILYNDIVYPLLIKNNFLKKIKEKKTEKKKNKSKKTKKKNKSR